MLGIVSKSMHIVVSFRICTKVPFFFRSTSLLYIVIYLHDSQFWKCHRYWFHERIWSKQAGSEWSARKCQLSLNSQDIHFHQGVLYELLVHVFRICKDAFLQTYLCGHWSKYLYKYSRQFSHMNTLLSPSIPRNNDIHFHHNYMQKQSES